MDVNKFQSSSCTKSDKSKWISQESFQTLETTASKATRGDLRGWIEGADVQHRTHCED